MLADVHVHEPPPLDAPRGIHGPETPKSFVMFWGGENRQQLCVVDPVAWANHRMPKTICRHREFDWHKWFVFPPEKSELFLLKLAVDLKFSQHTCVDDSRHVIVQYD